MNKTRCKNRSHVAAVLVGLTFAATTLPAAGQTNPMVWEDVPVDRDSGILRADGAGGDKPQRLYSTVVTMKGADWVRLRFGDVKISGSLRDSRSSFVTVTSLKDGGEQVLHLRSLQDWRYMSAYFNGDAVRVDLFATPESGDTRVEIIGAWAGEPNFAGGGLISSQCGPTDDRTRSNDARTGRLVPAGCTGFLIADGSDSCALTAGHCQNPVGFNDTLEFNVPPSNANGSTNRADPDDQYPIDFASIQSFDDGDGLIGNDWCYFGTFVNSNTGLFPRIAQGVTGFTVPGAQPAVDGSTINNWGFGVDDNDPTRSQTQQFDSGIYDLTDGASVFYNDIDTQGGSSGSPILKVNTNQIVAIHTNAGCNTDGSGDNSGTRIDNAGLQNALANPIGICAGGGPLCGDAAAGSCYEVNGSVACDDATCCQTVCAADAFCCSADWDSICVAEAFDLCGNCGDPAAGDCCVANGTPGCNIDSCCQAVCVVDPFCCNFNWDGLCASGAANLCPACMDPTGACCFGAFPNESCLDDLTAADCAAQGGVYQGDDTTCAAVRCDDLCPGQGDCCVDNGTPGCNDEVCCKTVCAVDPFCCNNAWDGICAGEAQDMCAVCGVGAGQELLTNGSFETGDFTGWTVTAGGTGGCDTDWNVSTLGTATGCTARDNPIDGAWAAYNSFDGNANDFVLTQTVLLPGAFSNAKLSWLETLIVNNFGPTTREWRVSLLDQFGTPITVLHSMIFPPGVITDTGTWGAQTFDVTSELLPFAGQPIQIEFRNVIPGVFHGPAGTGLDAASLSVSKPQQLLANGSFESGDFTGWTVTAVGTGGCDTDWNVSMLGSATGCLLRDNPIDGVWAAYNSFDGNANDFVLTQTVFLPGEFSTATLSWLETLVVDNFGPTTREWRVSLFDQFGGPIIVMHSILFPPVVVTDTGPWAAQSFDVTSALQPFAGQNIQVEFRNIIPGVFNGPAGTGLDAASLTVTKPQQFLTNGSFETGDFNGWTVTASGGAGCDVDWNVSTTGTATGCLNRDDPIAGSFAAYNAFDGNALDFVLSQTILLPAAVANAKLSWLETLVVDNFGPQAREWRVTLLDQFNAPITVVHSVPFPPAVVTDTGTWALQNLNVTAALQPFAGQPVTIEFRNIIPGNFEGPGGAGLDNVQLSLTKCPWDCGGDNDDNVGIVDFLALLGQWAQVGTSCDFDGSGVGIVAFLELLAHWGACP